MGWLALRVTLTLVYCSCFGHALLLVEPASFHLLRGANTQAHVSKRQDFGNAASSFLPRPGVTAIQPTWAVLRFGAQMKTKALGALKLALALAVLVACMLLAGWVDGAEIEAHDAWYAEQTTRTWCL